MSRSYRRPYQAVTGSPSAKEDKRLAARGMRRKQNEWLRNHQDYEENGLIPHRLECRHNDVWGWTRDGRQRLVAPEPRHWSEYSRIQQGLFTGPWEERLEKEHPTVWPPEWFIESMRK